MSVSGLNGVSGVTDSTATTSTKKTVGQDEFLMLFVTQLRFQDPLSPLDSSEFTSQMAQFSSLEQLTQINDGVAVLAASQNSLQNAYLTGLIGRKVGYEAGSEDGVPKTATGTVTGVSYDSDATYLVVDGKTKVALGDIKSIQ
ncbi:MAG: flagellar hook capping FlgD N-terminal domain-containing protein [Thermodesulfobacteriota bacterium]